MFLKQSTSQVFRIGPFLDSTDGVTPETGLTIANTDVDLSKDGGAFASKNSGGLTVDGSNGWYSGTFDTTDTATVGILEVEVTVSGALPVWKTYYVLEEAIYDAQYAAGAAGYNTVTPPSVSDILTTQMTEAYAADGTPPTLAQAIFLIQQTIGDFAIAGTTITAKRIDGSTTAATYTLDDGTNPTSRTRTT